MTIFTSFCLILFISNLLLSPGEAWFLPHDLVPFHKSIIDCDFDWHNIQPSSELKHWQQCYSGFECARLEVPLDWTNITNPNRVVLAISRLPAKVNQTDETYGGPIILNPGGPGGSGVDFLIWGGQEIQANLDGEKHFDIVSFDPRGVHHTTPSSACFDSSKSRELSFTKITCEGLIDISDEAFNSKWATAQSFSKICSNSKLGQYPDGSNIRQFAGTTMVAYDMLAIVDKLEDEARRKGPKRDDNTNSHGPFALLQYWGFSYGSLLGNTFASMFPHRTGRMILDGIVDAPDYYATRWSANLQDSMKTWALFLEFCYQGKEKCPLHDQNIKSAQDIELKVGKLLESLKENPLPAVDNGTVQIITASDVRKQIFTAMYFPYARFSELAKMLVELINGNTSSLIPASLSSRITMDQTKTSLKSTEGSLWQSSTASQKKGSHNSSWDRPFCPNYPHANEAEDAILCADGDSLQNRTKAQERAYIKLLTSQSPMFGGIFATITLPCISWPDSLHPKEHHRFIGPFGSKLSDLDRRAKPILWIGNTADPVTPVRNAFNMARAHEGSVVLVVDQPGHCTLANPSQCVYKVAKAYFTKGILPKEGTVCRPDILPWQDLEDDIKMSAWPR